MEPQLRAGLAARPPRPGWLHAGPAASQRGAGGGKPTAASEALCVADASWSQETVSQTVLGLDDLASLEDAGQLFRQGFQILRESNVLLVVDWCAGFGEMSRSGIAVPVTPSQGTRCPLTCHWGCDVSTWLGVRLGSALWVTPRITVLFGGVSATHTDSGPDHPLGIHG